MIIVPAVAHCSTTRQSPTIALTRFKSKVVSHSIHGVTATAAAILQQLLFLLQKTKLPFTQDAGCFVCSFHNYSRAYQPISSMSGGSMDGHVSYMYVSAIRPWESSLLQTNRPTDLYSGRRSCRRLRRDFISSEFYTS